MTLSNALLTFNLARTLALEAGLVFSRPQIGFTVAGDSEGASEFTARGERLSQYFAEAGVLYFVPRLAFAGGRGRAFVGGGGGYLRQLHAGRILVETGQVYHAGGGIKYYLRRRHAGLIKGLGLRLDARACFLSGGYTFDGRTARTVSIGAGLVAGF